MFRGNISAFSDVVTENAYVRIKERTNGFLDIKTVPNGALPIKQNDQLRAVSDGQLEMCLGQGDYHSGDFPLWGITNISYLAQNQLEKAQIAEACRPIFESELNKMDVHILAYQPYVGVGFWTTEPFDNIMDMGGEKVRAQAKIYVTMLEAMNGVGVPVEWAECYTSLQRGLVKGVFTGFDSVTSAKLYEVAPYCTDIKQSALLPFIVVNKGKWDALPDDVKIIVLEELRDAMVVIQAQVPESIKGEIAKQMAGGLKEFNSDPPEGWFELMAEKVTKPVLIEEVAKCGALGQDVVNAIEKALGRKIL